MNKLRNRVQLIGRIGVDLDLKNLENGKSLLNFSLATNDFYKDKEGNKVQNTEWHRVVAWGKQAQNISKICKKGDELAIDGKLVYKQFEKDGETRYITEILLNEFAVMNTAEKTTP